MILQMAATPSVRKTAGEKAHWQHSYALCCSDSGMKGDPLENERKRYSPWQKGVYGGELQFESEGKQYSVRRTFGSKSAEDEFQLTDTKTNLPCRDFTQNLGEELFRIDAGSFERTIFISQNDCETFVTDGINAKIGIWRRIRTISIILRQRTSG